jgi:hypothetical protein
MLELVEGGVVVKDAQPYRQVGIDNSDWAVLTRSRV